MCGWSQASGPLQDGAGWTAPPPAGAAGRTASVHDPLHRDHRCAVSGGSARIQACHGRSPCRSPPEDRCEDPSIAEGRCRMRRGRMGARAQRNAGASGRSGLVMAFRRKDAARLHGVDLCGKPQARGRRSLAGVPVPGRAWPRARFRPGRAAGFRRPVAVGTSPAAFGAAPAPALVRGLPSGPASCPLRGRRRALRRRFAHSEPSCRAGPCGEPPRTAAGLEISSWNGPVGDGGSDALGRSRPPPPFALRIFAVFFASRRLTVEPGRCGPVRGRAETSMGW